MADNAADVADDYRQALEDLTANSRIEIATLTNIARENASHGLAITEVLQNHIKKVPPARTLPALYVLDSVVKNVPTPYALYFGPKLYSIFMGAYTKVDYVTRRKMDEMLKTWKEPVPGSISTKPVFPPEYVRPIENALIAARDVAYAAQKSSFQGQQQLLRGNRPPVPTRDTPTPPTARPAPYQAGPHVQQPFPGPPGGPIQQPQQQQQQQYGDMAHQPYPMRPHNGPNMIPSRATAQPLPLAGPSHYQQPAPREAYGTPQPGISIDKLRDDIQQLIVAEKAEFARDPHDTSKQTRLLALLDLQTLIQSPDVPREQLMLVKERVSELAVNMRAHNSAAPPLLPHPAFTPTPPVVPQQPPPVHPVAVASRPPPAPVNAAGLSIDTLFGQGALATLLGGIGKPPTPQAPTPQLLPVAVPPVRATPPLPPVPRPVEPAKPPPASNLSTNPSALLAMLRQSGLLAAGAPAAAPAPLAPNSANFAPPVMAAPQPSADQGFYLHLKPAALKQFRPDLVARIHDDLGPPCTQCGRRFRTDEEGRRKKTTHMDWHFRVHQRIVEAEKRGQHRSWYLSDELVRYLSFFPLLAPRSSRANRMPGLGQVPRGNRRGLRRARVGIAEPRRRRRQRWRQRRQRRWQRRRTVGEAGKPAVHTRARGPVARQQHVPHLPGALRDEVAGRGAGVGMDGRRQGRREGVPRHVP
ncbi:hypothetical protein B0T22DRAFT_384401 [Podospora appendiculata]|uniref:CID domain-containing protein n=1 Tax=Podospora appendiculata TaxID=314037 RepID=A0AAE0X2P3_9PEZI|nr:hypothetical protein B0T22DRAFT_384401 [Podospora appendiculata]